MKRAVFLRALGVALLLAGLLPSTLSAGTITTYSVRVNFLAAVGSTTVEDFTNTSHFPITTGVLNSSTNLPAIGIAPGDIEPGVTYSAPVPDPIQNYFNIDAGGGFPTPFLDSLFPPRPLTVTFDGPVAAFGFDTNSLMSPSFGITINFVSGPAYTQTFTVSGSFPVFFGFQSSSADIVSAVINSQSTSFGFALDNFTFTNSYDLVSDWSDSSNPNGVWAYREGSNPLPHVNAWESSFGSFSVPQPGWSESENGNNRLPFWFKSNGSETFTHDWQAGDVLVHTTDPGNGVGNGIANVTWTSPGNGTVNLSGAVWNGRNIGRSNDWRILVNGSAITGGSLLSGDGHTRASPFNLATGSGGSSALFGIPVSANDVIELDLVKTSGAGDFVGVNFTENFAPRSTTTTPPVISSICGPSNQAGISGSTGAQGVLDPANTDAAKG
ncbi:MAG: hypothetical protein HY648_10895, partial [Acidobacteria bacterium]|nr:hypothetical protein [Acidobacteriota bacterium]